MVAGVVVFGGKAAPAPPYICGRGVLLGLEWLRKTRATQAVGGCPRMPGWGGVAELRPLFLGAQQCVISRARPTADLRTKAFQQCTRRKWFCADDAITLTGILVAL
jgi:hypothetical protein